MKKEKLIKSASSIWSALWEEAIKACEREPTLKPLIENTITCSRNLPEAVSRLLAYKLADSHISEEMLTPHFERFCADSGTKLNDVMAADLEALLKNDPAAADVLCPFLFYKGFHALESYRLANYLWINGNHLMARFVQNRISDVFGVDIHPAAKIGKGIMMDHATGIVIGETAVVEDGVLFWHAVTLGGKDPANIGGDRHPKIRKNAMLGAGSTIIGNVTVGASAKVAAGSVVVKDVEPGSTVAGTAATEI
jgi:serine O-acetyltransferase